MDKLTILKQALEARNDEVMGYQINIDNYARAIEKISSDYPDIPQMMEFRDHLNSLLDSHKVEQLKAIIIRDVIADQVRELEAG